VDTRSGIFFSSRDIVQECQLFAGANYVSDSRNSGNFLRGNLRITTQDGNFCCTVTTGGSADKLARLHGGAAGDGTSVDAVEVGLFGKGADLEVTFEKYLFDVGRFALVDLAA
jgi:hypothetical protein